MKTEPDWIEHDGSAVCPVPAGHDVEVRYRDGQTFRDSIPLSHVWHNLPKQPLLDITHYRDWTAFEQQQASAEVPGGWQPIDTAPKDGTRFIATGHDYGDPNNPRHLAVAVYDCGEWREADDENTTLMYLTHWLPFPAAHEQPPVDPLRTALDEAGDECGFHISEDFVAACRARGVTVAKGAGTIQHLGSHTPQPFSDD